MASGFVFRADTLQRNIVELDAKIYGAVSAAVEYTSDGAEAQMKGEAPWTDQTAAARTGLHTQTFNELRAWTIVLAHAVNYGIWLETRNDFNGRYAIILPVLVDSGNRLMAMLEGLFGKVE